jgi:hypothetical protein
MAQAQHKQDEAHAVAEEADRGRSGHGRRASEVSAMRKRQHRINRAGHDTLDCGYLYRIRGTELARQIVIDASA